MEESFRSKEAVRIFSSMRRVFLGDGLGGFFDKADDVAHARMRPARRSR